MQETDSSGSESQQRSKHENSLSVSESFQQEKNGARRVEIERV